MLEISKTIHHCEICSRVCFKMKDLHVFPLEMLHFRKKNVEAIHMHANLKSAHSRHYERNPAYQLIGGLICRLSRYSPGFHQQYCSPSSVFSRFPMNVPRLQWKFAVHYPKKGPQK